MGGHNGLGPLKGSGSQGRSDGNRKKFSSANNYVGLEGGPAPEGGSPAAILTLALQDPELTTQMNRDGTPDPGNRKDPFVSP